MTVSMDDVIRDIINENPEATPGQRREEFWKFLGNADSEIVGAMLGDALMNALSDDFTPIVNALFDVRDRKARAEARTEARRATLPQPTKRKPVMERRAS